MPIGPYENFEECVSRSEGWADDPRAYCGWLEQQSKDGRSDGADGLKYKCDHCDTMVDISYEKDSGPIYATHDMNGEKCPMSGKPLHVPTAKKDAARVRRYDRAPLASVTRTQEGFLKIDGSKIARIGIQEYRRADGTVVREFRDPKEVFNADSLKSYALQPLTNTHPAKMLDTRDAKKHAVGAVGEAVKLDGKWVTAPISVWDVDAIRAIEDGRVQLSAGYSCELVEEAGMYEGERYDCRQANIVVNHLALVDFARAGNEARLRLDSGDAECIFDSAKSDMQTGNQELRKMAQLKIDGLTFQVSDENIQAAVDKALAEREQKTAAITKKCDELENARAEAEKKRSEAEAKLDAEIEKATAASEKEIKCDECGGKTGTDCKNCDGKGMYPAKMDTAERRAASVGRMVEKRAHERALLVSEARRHLGLNEKLDGRSDTDIKRAIIAKLSPKTKLDGKDDGYINARYDAALESVGAVVAIDSVRAVVQPVVQTATDSVRSDESVLSPEDARRRSDEMYRTAHYKTKK